MEPLDQELFVSPLVEVATFRVRPDDPRFNDSGPVQRHIFVFPRLSVRITHAGAEPVVADANTVMFYNRDQIYRRDAVSEDGDRCDWFGVPEEAIAEALADYDPAVRDRPGRPYTISWGPCSPEIYLAQRRLTEALRGGADIEPLAVEETVLQILDKAVASAYGRTKGRGRKVGQRAARTRAELAEAARAMVGQLFMQPLTLDQLAEQLRTSPFHLSRVFRAHCGTPLHRYMTELRLRASLERLTEPNLDLTELALDLGFASHSHFTERFRKAFGSPPSTVRRRLRVRRASDRAKIRQRVLS